MALKSSKEKIYLTKESFQQYKDRLKFLQEVARPQVIEEIKEARGQGDLSENAEYDSARDKQAAIENEINEIQHILDNYEIIKSTNTNVVKIGSKVQIISLTNDNIQEVTIVGSLDADPFSGKISNTSALAKALLDKEVNSIIEVEAPKKYKVKILSIK
ncbi:transcription elongation factor GreA [Metamycoplasma faucium]|jgi:transcription elongation factor greA|uniref:Transcription elongation factor GreA n=1 Tax=Metamycoplasma faucium TaxID=56142 RepID=A0ABZ2TL03_9BACT